MKYVFVISTLVAGGAERALSELASHFARRGSEVVVATFTNPDAVDFYPLDATVRRIRLGNPPPPRSARDKLSGNLLRIRCLRRLLQQERPDAVLAFMDTVNVTTVLAAAWLRIRVVIAERTDPATNQMVPSIWRLGRRATYRFADMTIAQTQAAAAWLRDNCGGRVCVIPNVLRALPQPAGTREPLLLSVGRLDGNKGFDVVIDAFARVHGQFPGWRLVIVGDGPLRDGLALRARDAGVGEKVTLVGSTREIEHWYARASVLAQGSRLEGFPNVLLEAMGMGIPVVSTDCRCGPSDLIRHGVDGLLVPVNDVEAMAAALGALMDDEGMRSRLGNAALDVRQRFAPENVLPLWERALGRSGPA